MKALLRTLRGLMGIGLTWGTLWAMTILVIGLVIWLVDHASMEPGEGPLAAAAIIGFQGLVAGIVFGIVLSFAEIQKRILDLSLIRVALWGVLASAVLPFLTGMPAGMTWFVCILGAVSATASVAIARKAELRESQHQRFLDSATFPT